MKTMHVVTFSLGIVLLPLSASAQVVETTNHTLWQNSVGAYTSLTFTDLPNFTIVTTQYSPLGITFTDGNDHVHVTTAYSDQHGLVSSDGGGNLGTIHMSFSQPQHWLGFDFIGGLRVALYSQGALLYTGGPHAADFGPFLGFVSVQPFDAAIAWDYSDDVVAVDNMYFGPPVPAPGALALLALAGLTSTSRRRRPYGKQNRRALMGKTRRG